MHEYVPPLAKRDEGIGRDTNEIATSSSANVATATGRHFPPGDGTFNNIPIYFRQSPKFSTVRCVGESFEPDTSDRSHHSRSCMFQHLCFNTTSERFLLFRSPDEDQVHEYTQNRKTSFRAIMSSTMYNKSVALGPMGKTQLKKEGDRLDLFKWFPDIVEHNAASPVSFYELPHNFVWVPIQVMGGHNPGHLLWDSFLTVFKLLTIFGIEDKPLLVTRMHLGKPVWGTCEMTNAILEKCRKLIPKFIPILATASEWFSTSHDFVVETKEPRQSDLVCAPMGAAGLGLLSDHGWGQHGQDASDFVDYRFAGQSSILRQFRDYGMKNLGVVKKPSLKTPFRVVFSVNSTGSAIRRTDFAQEFAACQKAFQNDPDVTVEAVVLASMSLAEQIEYISETSILISVTGGGTATATFLPDGASLFLIYMVRSGQPQFHDFGIFENAGYIRPHWIPSLESPEERAGVLVQAISFEIERLKIDQRSTA